MLMNADLIKPLSVMMICALPTRYGMTLFLRGFYLNLIRLVHIRGGKKKDTTSLEMAVSVFMAPHQILVSNA